MRFSLLCFVLILFGCGANESILKSGKETPPPSASDSDTTPLEQEIESMRTAKFTFIFVLRRKDAGLIDSEDRGVIRSNTADANRRISADGGRAFVIGSNFQLQAANMAALYERFAVEDHSPAPVPGADFNVNANVTPKPDATTNSNAGPKKSVKANK